MNKFTLVTGLWNLGRDKLGDFGRPFDHYLDRFKELLSLDFNMVVYIPEELEELVYKHRDMDKTIIVNKELEEFKTYCPWFDKIQTIRTDHYWRSQAGWLTDSPQAQLEYYNPVVMSKMFMLNDASINKWFDADYLFWIDAGLTNTVSLETLKNMKRLPDYMFDKKFLFLSFPYRNESEVHGFASDKFDEMCGEPSSYVCRGGFFGGHRKYLKDLNALYYGIADDCFFKEVMGTEENFHTILTHKRKDITRFEIEGDGLVYPFFEHLSGVKESITGNASLIPYDKKKDVFDIKTSLYVLSYNSPNQFDKVAESWKDFSVSRRILVDNSTDTSTYMKYNELCKKHGFEHIKKETNIGICGGRQFVASHFNESDSEYYIFVEDDMNLCTDEENLYYKSLSIMHMNRYDYLKLSFKEFYGDNETQWAWYNIPQEIRDEYFPDNNKLPEVGFAENPPKIEPKQRKRFKGLIYLEGDYYYCNWPLWFSREGNRKVFLDTIWENPYEQTWMSNVFQLQMKGKIKAAVLDLSPINHERFEYYPAEDRIES